jgi:hypothetical protein
MKHTLTALLIALATPAMADPAIHNMTKCLKAQAAALDDGVSDAASVAAAVGTACFKEENGVRDVVRARCGGNSDCEQVAMTPIKRTISDLSIRAVLEHRRGTHDPG